MDIKHIRKDYEAGQLSEEHLVAHPIDQFGLWLDEAINSFVLEPTAMCLATASSANRPSCRYVLLKEFNEKGFLFFTNYESRKSKELDQNPFASAVFWWKELEKQVMIEGMVEKADRQTAEYHFALRPKPSQIAAWASRQDEPLASREALETSYAVFQQQFSEKAIPPPPYWGGFRLIPTRFEFWQGRKSRLHDRFSYELENGKWIIKRLSP